MDDTNPDVESKTMRLVIPNPEKMRTINCNKCTDLSSRTEAVFIGGVPWKFYAHLDEQEDLPYIPFLSMYLICCWEVQTSWNISVIAVLRVVNLENSNRSQEQTHLLTVCSALPSAAFKTIMEWDDVLRGNFIRQNRLVLEMDLTVTEKSSVARRIHDFGLVGPDEGANIEMVIGGRPMNVNARILSFHSDWFNRRIFGRKRRAGFENHLAGLDFKDFSNFLQLIYGHVRVLTIENVERVLKLGAQFEAKMVIRLCEQFVMRSKFMSRTWKLVLATAYKLKYLQKMLVNSVDSEEEIDRQYAFLNYMKPSERDPIRYKMECQLLKKNRMKIEEDGVRIGLKCSLALGERHYSNLTKIKHDIPFRLGAKLRKPHKYELVDELASKRTLRVSTECFWSAMSDWYCVATVKYSLMFYYSSKCEEFTATKTFSHTQPRFYQDFEAFCDEEIFFEVDADITVHKFVRSVFKKKQLPFRSSSLSNVVLKVDGLKFHVIKEMLAHESTYFHTMFFDGDFKERKQKSIEIHGFGGREFGELLQMIHQPMRPVTKDNAQTLLRLADYFMVTSVKERCDWYVKNSREHYRSEKEEMAVEFQLENTLLELVDKNAMFHSSPKKIV